MKYGIDVSRVKGVQTPRILVSPANSEPSLRSAGQEAVDLAAAAGLKLDPWQRLFMHHALLERNNEFAPDGAAKWASRQIGLMVSRQNGKGSILEAYELFCMFVLPDKLIIHSAHMADTAFEGFQRIEALIAQTPELKAEVARITWSHGSEGITLKDGTRLRFRTRNKGGGRGFTADKVILDEAMYLDAKLMAALIPTMSAVPNPQFVLTGSAGDQDSTAFGKMRQEALSGAERLTWMEWSVEPCSPMCVKGCTDHDAVSIPDGVKGPAELERAFVRLSDSYAKANPGLGIRQNIEFFETERKAMDVDTFAQERMGVGDWPVEGQAWRIIPEDAWRARFNETSRPSGHVAIGVDTSPNLKYSALVVCGGNELDVPGSDGQIIRGRHVEITGDGVRYDYRPGIDWVVERCAAIAQKRGKSKVTFVIDKAGQAGGFVQELESRGLTVVTPNGREYAQACGKFYMGVVPTKESTPFLSHIDQPQLNSAIAAADKRDLSDAWAWDKRNPASDISPLVAASLALWGYETHVFTKRAKPKFSFG